MKKSFLFMVTLLFGYAVSAQDTEKLLSSYLSVKDALVSSDNQTSSKAIANFLESVKIDKAFAQKKELLKAAEALQKAEDIEKQRTAFEKVSTIMWDIVKQSDSLTRDVYYQYCPMKKAYWLSGETEIRNPYYGSKMLNCGSVKDKKLKP